MAGKQAKLLSHVDIAAMLRLVRHDRYPARDRVIVLLSFKAGLRAGEIANLDWEMVVDNRGRVARTIELHDRAAKKCSGRQIPIHPALREALIDLRKATEGDGPVIRSERGRRMRPGSIVNWFAVIYRRLGLKGCSSHSGRRTFITKAAINVHRAGGSLRDVQQLAGHRSIDMTQAYIEGFAAAKRRLVDLI